MVGYVEVIPIAMWRKKKVRIKRYVRNVARGSRNLSMSLFPAGPSVNGNPWVVSNYEDATPFAKLANCLFKRSGVVTFACQQLDVSTHTLQPPPTNFSVFISV